MDGGTAHQDGIETLERIDALQHIHGLGQLQRGERGIGAVAGAGELRGGAGEGRDIKAFAEIEAERIHPGHQGTDEDLDAGDVVGGHRQEPLPRAAEDLVGGIGAGHQVGRR